MEGHQRTLAEALDLLEQVGPLLACVDWSQVETTTKLETVARLQEAVTSVESSTVSLAGDLSRGKQVETAGWASAKDFLTAATGGHKGAGPGLVRLAKRLDGLTETAAAFRSGWLSRAKAEVIAGKIASLPRHEKLRGDAEELLLERARVLDATEVRMVVTTDLETLRTGLVKHFGGLLPDGERLSVAAVRRLACDAEIIPMVLGSQSQVLDEGRAKRLVTPAIWHALVFRDRHCAFPGCRRQPIACEAHHIVSWADGGPTSLWNLVLLCGKHHTLLHESPWQARINLADGRPEFRPPPGRDGPRDWIRERPPHLLVA